MNHLINEPFYSKMLSRNDSTTNQLNNTFISLVNSIH